jgi:hypothetical protein
MSDVRKAIAAIRDGVCAILRIAPSPVAGQFNLAIVGTTWCIASNRTFVTAHHVLNAGNPRDTSHRFYVLRAPGNGRALNYWPVTGFRLEDATRDLVILDAPVPAGQGLAVPGIPVTMTPPEDGTPVLTYGCPAPVIASAGVSNQGDLATIQTILFTHASTGIVAAQYRKSPSPDIIFEFSVGWHHGESGGPVCRLDREVAAFAVMQHYRNIQGPHGTMAGPRRGLALSAIQAELNSAGATFI